VHPTYISVHIHVVGDFTGALARSMGCDFDMRANKDSAGCLVAVDADPHLNRVLPRVLIDGPFGSASKDFLNYETVLLVGAGIGVTPFASILKSIWYCMNNFNTTKHTHPSKVCVLILSPICYTLRSTGLFQLGNP
jgi:NADPH oxidase 2